MDALDRVKYVLAQLPREDLKKLSEFLNGLIVTDEEVERVHEGGNIAVATVTTRRRASSARAAPGAAAPAARAAKEPTVTYRQELVKCGKAGCAKCPHGPYVYKYWRDGGRLRKQYVGKATARATRQATLQGPDAKPHDGPTASERP